MGALSRLPEWAVASMRTTTTRQDLNLGLVWRAVRSELHVLPHVAPDADCRFAWREGLPARARQRDREHTPPSAILAVGYGASRECSENAGVTGCVWLNRGLPVGWSGRRRMGRVLLRTAAALAAIAEDARPGQRVQVVAFHAPDDPAGFVLVEQSPRARVLVFP